MITLQAESLVPTDFGNFRVMAFSDSEKDWMPHIALVAENTDFSKPINVRFHSECITGEVFHSKKCECGQQLDAAMKFIQENGGIIVYLRQEGRNIGIINNVLDAIGASGLKQKWIGGNTLSPYSIAIIYFWQQLGYLVTVFIAGLKMIPGEVLEAVEIDGASFIQKTMYVTIPMMKSTISTVAVLIITGVFKIFEIVQQTDVHVEHRNGVLNPSRAVEDSNRMPDRLDADAVDGDLPGVRRVLYIRHDGSVWSFDCVHCCS